MIERHKRILEALAECGRTQVSTLAESLNVSQVTMRKDLIALEELGLVRRAPRVRVHRFGGRRFRRAWPITTM